MPAHPAHETARAAASLAAAHAPAAALENVISVDLHETGAVIDFSRAALSRLEQLVSATVDKVISRHGERESYKIVLNPEQEGLAELHFAAHASSVARIEAIALLRLVPLGGGRYMIRELAGRDGERIEIPKAEPPPAAPEASKPTLERSVPAGGGLVFDELEAPAGEEALPAAPSKRKPRTVQGGGADAARFAIERALLSQARAKEDAARIVPDRAIDFVIDDFLRKEHKHIVAARQRDEKQRGGPNVEVTWAGKMLDTVAAHRQKPGNSEKPLLCELLRSTLNTANSVPLPLREAGVRFTEFVAQKAHGKAALWAVQILEEFGYRQQEEKIEAVYRNVTLQQILARLQPDKPIDVQNKGLRQLEEHVSRQVTVVRRTPDEAQKRALADECAAAMHFAETTKAFHALPAENRKDLNTAFSRTRERLYRGLPPERRKQ